MNDRFKFRFWDKETQTMQKIPIVELRHRITLDKIFADDRVIFMQCTGLEDKNGKLIYEGDIVKFNYDTDEIRAVVSWDNKELIGFYLNATDYFKDEYVTDYDFYKNDYEVIGNIYENKSLLESEG